MVLCQQALPLRLSLCLRGAHQASLPSQVKKIVEEPVLKSLDAVVTGVIEVRLLRASRPGPWPCPDLTAEQWSVCPPHRCEPSEEGLTWISPGFRPGLDLTPCGPCPRCLLGRYSSWCTPLMGAGTAGLACERVAYARPPPILSLCRTVAHSSSHSQEVSLPRTLATLGQSAFAFLGGISEGGSRR